MLLLFATIILTAATYLGIKKAAMRANSGGVGGFAPFIVLCDSCDGSLARHAVDCQRGQTLDRRPRIDVREVKTNAKRLPVARAVKGAN